MIIVLGIFDVGSLIVAALRYWRISAGLLVAASTMVVVCFFASSPAIRWIVGFHIFVLIMTAGIVWEQKRGRLREDEHA